MFTAAPVGALMAYGVTFLFTSSYTSTLPDWLGWRIVFGTAVLPTLLGLVVRYTIKEPDSFANIDRKSTSIKELFTKPLIKTTIGACMTVIFALVSWYCVQSFIPVLARFLANEYAALNDTSHEQLTGLMDVYTCVGVLCFNLGGLFGTVAVYPIAQRLGRLWGMFFTNISQYFSVSYLLFCQCGFLMDSVCNTHTTHTSVDLVVS
jgi:MFS family permease